MLEDLMTKNNMNIARLAQRSGVGYNYVYKIVKNQTDFNRCGLETAKNIADALEIDLNQLYEYKESYFENRIYYKDQKDWDYQMYGELNAELNKLFLIGLEYHFAPDSLSRDIKSCKSFDMEISCIRYDRLSEKTKCIMVAILNQQKRLKEFTGVYSNLEKLVNQKPLDEKLVLTKTPYNIFPSYVEMNIEY